MENSFVPLMIWFVLLFIGGCSMVAESPLNMKGMMAVDGMTVVSTGKTISDHFISYTSGKNCSTVRRQIGQNFCEEDDLSEPEEIYCYNSLGDVNCFGTPQPFGQGNKTIDHVTDKSRLIR
jgi:hypothetical protein